MKNLILKKVCAIAFIVLLVNLTFSAAISLAPIDEKTKEKLDNLPFVSAQANGCCVKDITGGYCSVTNKTQCNTNSNFYEGSTCSAIGIDACQVGTCIEETGTCTTYKTKQQCTDGKGFFTTNALSEVAECQPGCCIYKRDDGSIAFTEWKSFRKRCELSATNYDLNYEITDDTPKDCALMISAETGGYCWLATKCSYGKRADCPEEGVFSQEPCPNCPTFDRLKCSNGDVYEANACGGLGKISQGCTTGVSICSQTNSTFAECANIECKINLSATTLNYDTAWLKAGEIGVWDKNGQNASREGAVVTLAGGESACVQYQGPGESHYIYVCNNDGTTGRVETNLLTASRTKVCYYDSNLGAAASITNNYQNCGGCSSGSSLNSDALRDLLVALGGETLTPEWWNYRYFNPGMCDDTSTCEAIGSANGVSFCKHVSNNDCVPKYTPGFGSESASNLCIECESTKASSPWHKCQDPVQCNSRGYCVHQSNNWHWEGAFSVCLAETVSSYMAKGVFEGAVDVLDWLAGGALKKEKTDPNSETNKPVEEKKTGILDSIGRGLKEIFTLGGILNKPFAALTAEARIYFSDFFGWKKADYDAAKDKEAETQKSIDAANKKIDDSEKGDTKAVADARGAITNLNPAYQTDGKVKLTFDSKEYYIDSNNKVYRYVPDKDSTKPVVLTEITKDIPAQITSSQKEINTYRTAEAALAADNKYLNDLKTITETTTTQIKTAEINLLTNPSNEQLLMHTKAYKDNTKDSVAIVTYIREKGGYTQVTYVDKEQVYIAKDAAGKEREISASDAKWGYWKNVAVPKLSETDRSNALKEQAYSQSVLGITGANRSIMEEARINTAKYYGSNFYVPLYVNRAATTGDYGKALTDRYKDWAGYGQNILDNAGAMAKSALWIIVFNTIMKAIGPDYIAKEALKIFGIPAYANPAYWMKAGVCGIVYAVHPGGWGACMGNPIATPMAACMLNSIATAQIGGLYTCNPASASEKSPYTGYENCYQCNPSYDPNRPCTRERCESLSQQGASACYFDTIDALCKANETAIQNCAGTSSLKIDILSVTNATNISAGWRVTGVNFSLDTYTTEIQTNKFAECRYSNVKSSSFDNMTSIKAESNGKLHITNLDIRSADEKNTNFTYYIQCKDTCAAASRSALKEIQIVKKSKADSDGPLLDASKQQPQPDEYLAGSSTGKSNVIMKVVTDESSTCYYGRYKIAEGPQAFADGILQYNSTASRMLDAGKSQDEVILAMQEIATTPTKMTADAAKKVHSDNLQLLNNSQTYAYLIKCNDSSNPANPSSPYIVRFTVSEYYKAEVIKPVGIIDDYQPDLEAKTERNAMCRYSFNKETKYDDMTEFTETGGTSHKTQLDRELIYGSHTLYVKCKDGNGNIAVAEGGFSIIKDVASPAVVRAYKDVGAISDSLIIMTNEQSKCEYAFKSFSFGQGSATTGNEPPSRVHMLDWKTDVTYYIICEDRTGNKMPMFIAKPYEIATV